MRPTRSCMAPSYPPGVVAIVAISPANRSKLLTQAEAVRAGTGVIYSGSSNEQIPWRRQLRTVLSSRRPGNPRSPENPRLIQIASAGVGPPYPGGAGLERPHRQGGAAHGASAATGLETHCRDQSIALGSSNRLHPRQTDEGMEEPNLELRIGWPTVFTSTALGSS